MLSSKYTKEFLTKSFLVWYKRKKCICKAANLRRTYLQSTYVVNNNNNTFIYLLKLLEFNSTKIQEHFLPTRFIVIELMYSRRIYFCICVSHEIILKSTWIS